MEKNYKNKPQTVTVSLSFNDEIYQFNTELAKPIQI